MMKTTLSNGWRPLPLSELLELNQSGIWGDEGGEDDYPVLRSSNIHNGKLVLTDVAYRKIPSDKIADYKLDSGDILITKSSGSSHLIGKSCIFRNFGKKYYLFSNFTQRLRVKKEVLLPEFLYYYLNSSLAKEILQQISNTTSGLRNLNMREYGKQLIPLPSIPIQKKIASILEKADAAREKRRQANQLTKQFLQSAFLEMFGDPATNTKGWPVGIIADAVKYSEYGTSEKSNNEKQGYPIIGMGNITYDGQLDLSKLSYVNLSVDNFEKLKLRRGDLIFNRTNSTELVGKTTYWNLDTDAVIASYLVKLRLNKEFDSIWFLYLLNTRYFKIMFMRRCKKAVGQSNISPTLLKEFPIYIPPLSEQQKFAELVEKVDVLRTKQRQSEQELENLFNSLMQRAFNGKL